MSLLARFSRSPVTCHRFLSSSPVFRVMWPPGFEDPAKDVRELKEFKKSGEYERKMFVPIKAALNDATCSIFEDPIVLKFRQHIMTMGKKETADRLLMEVLTRMKYAQVQKWREAPEERKDLIETDPVKLINMAVENARPLLILNQVRVGSVVYQVKIM